MKKTLLSAALVLGLFPVSYVSAQDLQCTTGDNENGCGNCDISFWTNHNLLSCDYKGIDTSKRIDDCVENREGVMRPGLGAGDSCKDYHLENNILDAKCRNGAGDYVPTSIDIRQYFVVRESSVTASSDGIARPKLSIKGAYTGGTVEISPDLIVCAQ